MPNQDAPAVELRPAHLEDWLDGLPYADFQRTCDLLHGALRETNRQTLKSGLRLELARLYWRPYRYLLDSLARGGTQPLLHGAQALQQRSEALKQVALELAFAARRAMDEGEERRGVFGARPAPGGAAVLAARLLSHALVLNFLGYAPVPPAIWHELLELYAQAEAAGTANAAVPEPGGEAPDTDSLRQVLVQTAMTALADPYHLPPGAVWEIYVQVQAWSGRVRVEPFHEIRNPGGHFVIDLHGAAGPLSYARFDRRTVSAGHRLIDCSALQPLVQAQQAALAAGAAPPAGLRLKRQHAPLLLELLRRAWDLPPKRYFPRQPRKGPVHLACGFNAAFYFSNAEREFAAVTAPGGGEELDYDALAHDPSRYQAEQWIYADAGPGGFALRSAAAPRTPVRVGELVAMRDAGAANGAPWQLGVIRWLMVHPDLQHRVGVQIIARQPEPVAVRAPAAGDEPLEYRRGFLVAEPSATDGITLIAPRGLYRDGEVIELLSHGERLRLQAGRLRESTLVYDLFSCRR